MSVLTETRTPEVCAAPAVENKPKNILNVLLKALRNGELPRLQYDILLLFYTWSSAEGRVPDVTAATIAENLGYDTDDSHDMPTERTIRRHIKHLCEKGWLLSDHIQGQTGCYDLWLTRAMEGSVRGGRVSGTGSGTLRENITLYPSYPHVVTVSSSGSQPRTVSLTPSLPADESSTVQEFYRVFDEVKVDAESMDSKYKSFEIERTSWVVATRHKRDLIVLCKHVGTELVLAKWTEYLLDLPKNVQYVVHDFLLRHEESLRYEHSQKGVTCR